MESREGDKDWRETFDSLTHVSVSFSALSNFTNCSLFLAAQLSKVGQPSGKGGNYGCYLFLGCHFFSCAPFHGSQPFIMLSQLGFHCDDLLDKGGECGSDMVLCCHFFSWATVHGF